jgi:hypothetical protein
MILPEETTTLAVGGELAIPDRAKEVYCRSRQIAVLSLTMTLEISAFSERFRTINALETWIMNLCMASRYVSEVLLGSDIASHLSTDCFWNNLLHCEHR